MPSAKAQSNKASEHAQASGHEAIEALKAATGAAADATGSAAQSAQDYTNGVKQDAEDKANQVWYKSQDLSNQTIRGAKETGNQLSHYAGATVKEVQQTSTNILNQFIPPEQREKYSKDLQHFAKHSPLAFSFIVVQTIALSIPLAIITAISTGTIAISVGTALLSAAAVIASTVLFFLPILTGLFIGASVVWAILASTFFSINWVYTRVYHDSKFESDVQQFTARAAKWNREIEENAEDEASRYIENVNGGLQEGRAKLENTADDIKANGRANYENGADKVKQTARDGQANLESSADKVKTEARK